jgi:hypothetical protein
MGLLIVYIVPWQFPGIMEGGRQFRHPFSDAPFDPGPNGSERMPPVGDVAGLRSPPSEQLFDDLEAAAPGPSWLWRGALAAGNVTPPTSSWEWRKTESLLTRGMGREQDVGSGIIRRAGFFIECVGAREGAKGVRDGAAAGIENQPVILIPDPRQEKQWRTAQ